MPNYRRVYVPGGMFFFTLVTQGRVPILTDPDARGHLRRAFVDCRSRWPFRIEAIVLVPDHLHAIWSLPRGDTDYSIRWAWIKKEFTKSWVAEGGVEEAVSDSRRRNRRRGVWQRRFWEHSIQDEDDLERHCDYIHYNPVKHGLVRALLGMALQFLPSVRETRCLSGRVGKNGREFVFPPQANRRSR